LSKTLYRHLRGLGRAKDLLVVRQEDVERHGDNPYLVLHEALSQGKELYRAAS